VVSQSGTRAEVCLLVATLCRTQKCQVPDEFTERFLELCSVLQVQRGPREPASELPHPGDWLAHPPAGLAQPSRSAATPSALARCGACCRAPRPDGLLGRPHDESEEDAQMWDAVEAGAAQRRPGDPARTGSGSARPAARLVWLSMAELAGGLAGCSALTPIQRRCLLGQLHFLPELRLGGAWSPSSPGGGDDAGLPNRGPRFDSVDRRSDVLALACGYSVETVVYLDALANLFGLARLLFRMASCSDASADQLDSGLQLVIRLLEVLQIPGRAARTPDADGRVSGLADLIPLQAVLSCARPCRSELPVRRRGPAVPPLPPGPSQRAAACCRGLVDFLVGGGVFRPGRSAQRGTVARTAYEDMSPSRRPEVFAQLVESVGTGAHLWALLLLLNRRARSLQQQRRKRRQPPSQQQRLERRRRRRRPVRAADPATPTVNLVRQSRLQRAGRVRRRLEQLLACAGLIRYLLRRIDPASLGASSSAVSALPFLELDKAADEFGGDEYFGFDELDEELESALLPATAAAAELPAQLGVARSTFRRGPSGRHGRSRELCRSDDAAVRGFSQRVAMGNRAPATAAGPPSGQPVRSNHRAGRAGGAGVFNSCGSSAACWPGQSLRRKALDLMLSKLTGLDRAGAVPLLRQSLLDCLAGVERNYQGSQVALICGRELVRLLGRLRAEAGAELLFGHRRLQFLPAATTAADIYRGFELRQQQQQQQQLGIIRLCTAGVRRLGIEALPLVARLVPKLLPRLRPTVADQRPPGVVLLASFAFLQQCTVTMVDLMVPYLAQLLPVTVELMLSAAEAAPLSAELGGPRRRPSRPGCYLHLRRTASSPPPASQPALASRRQHLRQAARLKPGDGRVASRRPTAPGGGRFGQLLRFPLPLLSPVTRRLAMQTSEAELSDLFSSLLRLRLRSSGEEDADCGRQQAPAGLGRFPPLIAHVALAALQSGARVSRAAAGTAGAKLTRRQHADRPAAAAPRQRFASSLGRAGS
uniref:HECT domain-containing protein n=1 Tax=Macrostomum lignano TaxID=282301 RepID=A0A1I8F902_9PLAT